MSIVQQHQLYTPPANYQPPLGFVEPELPRLARLGVEPVGGGEVAWRPTGEYTPLHVAQADTEAEAIRRAARKALPIAAYETKYEHAIDRGWYGIDNRRYLKPVGTRPVGTSPHRLPMLITESPWNDHKRFDIVPAASVRAGAETANVGMPAIGTKLEAGFTLPEQRGGFHDGYKLRRPAQGRIIAMTDGERIVRFGPDARGAVEALDPKLAKGARALPMAGKAALGGALLLGAGYAGAKAAGVLD